MRNGIKLTALLSFFLQLSYSQTTPHFRLQKIKDGIYAAIAEKGGHAICNAGIIDLGDATIVIDPFLGLDAANALNDSAVKLTGRKVTHVINTHFHDDHVLGNQIFSNAKIISSIKTRELMMESLPDELKGAVQNAETKLEKLLAVDTSILSPFELEENKMWKGYYGAFVANSDDVVLTYPDVTFDEQMKIKGKNRSVVIKELGKGHTGSDVVVILPDDSIAFTGDLLFVGHHPWLGDGDPDEWIHRLLELDSLPVGLLIPGHGSTASKKELSPLSEYIKHVKSKAHDYHVTGKKPFGDPDLKIPAAYATWYLSLFYLPNVYNAYGLEQGE